MHVVFIPYGMRRWVEYLIRDMEAQKHMFRMTKDGKEDMHIIESSIRILPFGIYEYVFPKEDLDVVLTTLKAFKNPYPDRIPKTALKMLRKILDLKPVPKDFKVDKKFTWTNQNVAVILLGIREDGTIIEPEGMQFAGWEHERL